MLTPNIQFLNERFISHYGVDRILLLMAEHVASMGARVTFGCLRYNENLFDKKASISLLPAFDQDIFENIEKFMNAEKVATDGMIAKWLTDKPDIILIGGWPFFDLAARARSLGVRAVFIDAGAVPHTGYPESSKVIQQELRRIRAQTLPFIDKILPISNFIRLSQTEPDRCSSKGVRTIHLGADHLRHTPPHPTTPLLEELKALKRTGRKLILAAGRFEPIGYKNSMATIHVTRGISLSVPDVTLLVLQQPEYLPIPDDMTQNVKGIGNPSDYELLEIIRLLDLTLATSLWEGFNLPLAESQYEGCPSLAYACGSHPEVIADPWFLCQNEAEMALKSAQILKGEMPIVARASLQRYPERYTWKKTLKEIWEQIDGLFNEPLVAETRHQRRLVFFDVSDTEFNNKGLRAFQAVRALCANLINYPFLEIVFTRWDEDRKCFMLVSSDARTCSLDNPLTALNDVDISGVEIDRLLMACSQHCVLPPLLLFPFVPPHENWVKRIAWAHDKSLTCAAIMHDTTSTRSYAYSPRDPSSILRDWDRHLLAMDALICSSHAGLEALLAFAEKKGITTPHFCEHLVDHPPFGGVVREHQILTAPKDQVEILGILASDANESVPKLLKAHGRLRQRLPNHKITLTLVSVYNGEMRGSINGCADWQQWLGNVSRAKLRELLARAHFSIVPCLSGNTDSVVAESLWMGRPCICHGDAIRNEIASDGGCLSVDMHSERLIEGAMASVIEDDVLYRALAREAVTRPLIDWSKFVDDVAEKLYVM